MISDNNIHLRTRFRRLCLLAICLIGLLLNSPLSAKNIEQPLVQQGTIDLRNWDFSEYGAINLNGEWEFYWKQFLLSDQIDIKQSSPIYIKVPSNWQEKVINGSTLSGDGYATYRLTINLNPNDNDLKALRIPTIYTAYQMWINGEPVAAKGIIGTSRQSMIPHNAPNLVFIQPKNGKIELVIEVSNFYHIKGGLRKKIYLGNPSQIVASHMNALNLQMVLFGSMLVIGIYYLVHYLYRPKDKSSLYFSLFCLFMGIRLLFIGQSAIFNLFPDFSWSIAKRLDYSILYSGIPIFGLFLHSLYGQYISNRVLHILIGLSTFLLILTLFSPTKIYLSTLPFYQTMAFLGTIYYLFVLYKATLAKKAISYIPALAGLVLLVTIFNDLLNYNHVINTYDGLFPIGLLVFILSQSVILSKTYSLAISQAEKLSAENDQMIREITELNRNLEDNILQRTAQLNDVIEILNNEISERSEAEQKLRVYATTDIMTGLANRATGLNTLDYQLSAAKKNNFHLTVAFVDIDNLKVVNDQHGHKIGDDLIINIGKILRNHIRQSDSVSRIGGDEFLIIFPQCTLSEASLVWQRVEDAILRFNSTSNKPYQISLSYGFAEFTPGEELNSEDLVEAADSQMYRVKRPN